MKLLFDQNLSPRLAVHLAAEFPESMHVLDVGLATAVDATIWAYAAAHGLTIISKDVDFHARAILLGHPPKVVWVRLGNCRTSDVANLLRSRRGELLAFEADPVSGLLVLS